MRQSSRYKRWQHTRYLKEMRSRARIKSGLMKKRRSASGYSRARRKSRAPIMLHAPDHFSIVNNKEETLLFFNHAITEMERCSFHQDIFFDLKPIKTISPDAIMLLIALVKNIKRCKMMRAVCRGNLPDDPEARAYIERSGFYSYVKVHRPLPQPDLKAAIQISSGHEVDPALIGNICSFVSARAELPERLHTKGLYQIITELMTNTIQHAYTNGGPMDNRWYIYVEDSETTIQFIFLDTGVGIPSTIKVNFFEKVVQTLGSNANDAKLISSALKGDYRSETGERHRGKGLPNIYDASKTDRISKLNIISGYGQCMVDAKCAIIESSSSINFPGTLFCWQFDKVMEA